MNCVKLKALSSVRLSELARSNLVIEAFKKKTSLILALKKANGETNLLGSTSTL